MEAGASHQMPLRRRMSRLLVVLGSLACWGLVPAGASAQVAPTSVPAAAGEAINTVQSTVVTVAAPVEQATDDVAGAVKPSMAAAPPASGAGTGTVEQAVTPVAQAAAAGTQAAAATTSPAHLDEHAHARVSRISASASAQRDSVRPVARRTGWNEPAQQRPAGGPSASVQDAAPQAGATAGASEVAATPAPPAPERGSGLTSAPAASGAAAGFFFGGGLALLVGSLLLAGPCLRRLLSLPTAVCRPAAFLVVLERPG
jgi:hypothetical protein